MRSVSKSLTIKRQFIDEATQLMELSLAPGSWIFFVYQLDIVRWTVHLKLMRTGFYFEREEHNPA